MHVLFDIQAASSTYSVISERQAMDLRAPLMRTGVVIADLYFAARLAALNVQVIGLEANEHTKSLDALGAIIVQMRDMGANRNTHLWAIGGGAIQDVAAFIASTYMRGIGWTYLPTTLLGMVDSCIGGKSSINVGNYKNILGTFHTPKMVLLDADLIVSLSAEQRIAGLIEAAKICFCRSPAIFEAYLDLNPKANMVPECFEPIIKLSLEAKKWFIEIDEHDRAERLLLNLGHTFGHALEGASDYRLSHGIAVGVGILCAIELSGTLLGAPPRGMTQRLQTHVVELLGGMPGLAGILTSIDSRQVFERLKADKKHEPDYYRFVAMNHDGHATISRLAKSENSQAVIVKSISTILESLNQ